MSGRVAVVTIAAGRTGHLRRQRHGLAHGSLRPDRHVVVAMGDPALPDAVFLPVEGDRLPLAAARNHGASVAIADGAEALIFLDVDCIPSPYLVERYRDVLSDDGVYAGPVCYLPPPGPDGYSDADLAAATPHPARPAPPDGAVLDADDWRLFWSLSFAVTTETWHRIGGFCADYDGYGGEDTDFAETFHAKGFPLRWVGGAISYHQHHSVSTPPVEHLDDILRNAAVFHRRWGWWPMQGWLHAFADIGLITRGTWARLP